VSSGPAGAEGGRSQRLSKSEPSASDKMGMSVEVAGKMTESVFNLSNSSNSAKSSVAVMRLYHSIH
jgi:hypothetical protein